MTATKETPVVLAVSRKGHRILLVWRDRHLPAGDCWELPGGKQQAGETAAATLRRELHEELAWLVDAGAPLICFSWRYPDRLLRFDVY